MRSAEAIDLGTFQDNDYDSDNELWQDAPGVARVLLARPLFTALHMTKQEIAFLETFLSLYQDILAHEGFGDIEVSIRLLPGRRKEVRLRSGREFRYVIEVPAKGTSRKRYRIIEEPADRAAYRGPERRSGLDRRDYDNPRRKRNLPRDFRLERRVNPERRKGRGRRWDD